MRRATTLHDQNHTNFSESRSLLIAGADGHIHFAGPPAQICLDKHFGIEASRAQLPPELRHWLRHTAEKKGPPYLRRTDETLLQVTVVQEDANGAVCLVLEEVPVGQESAAVAQPSLTDRELEVLSWVRLGKSNQEIARLLNLRANTVKKHLQNIYVKLGVNNRTAAAGFTAEQQSVAARTQSPEAAASKASQIR